MPSSHEPAGRSPDERFRDLARLSAAGLLRLPRLSFPPKRTLPKAAQVVVDVVHDLADALRVFAKQQGQPTRERLNVVRVRRHQSHDLRGQVVLPPPRVGFEPTTRRLTAGMRNHRLEPEKLQMWGVYHPTGPLQGRGFDAWNCLNMRYSGVFCGRLR